MGTAGPQQQATVAVGTSGPQLPAPNRRTSTASARSQWAPQRQVPEEIFIGVARVVPRKTWKGIANSLGHLSQNVHEFDSPKRLPLDDLYEPAAEAASETVSQGESTEGASELELDGDAWLRCMSNAAGLPSCWTYNKTGTRVCRHHCCYHITTMATCSSPWHEKND